MTPPDGSTLRIVLGLAPARRWSDFEVLEKHTSLISCLGEGGAWLVAYGVRELLSNAGRHGEPTSGTAELLLDRAEATVILRIPGREFDSVSAAHDQTNRWLHRYGRMLIADGVAWGWRREGSLNVIELSFRESRLWIEGKEVQ